MSWLRPSRSVVDPRGTHWDIYVTRWRIRRWSDVTPDWDTPPGMETAGHSADVFWMLVPVMVVLELLIGVVKAIALVPFALGSAARNRRSLRVEAIVTYPTRQVYAWDVERPLLDGVLDEIVAALTRGSIAHPVDARFLGEIE